MSKAFFKYKGHFIKNDFLFDSILLNWFDYFTGVPSHARLVGENRLFTVFYVLLLLDFTSKQRRE